MRLFLLLSLFLIFYSCEEEVFQDVCVAPDDLTDCIPFAELSPEEHFSALLGEWELVYLLTSGISGMVIELCEEEIVVPPIIRFYADSSYLYTDEFGSITGDWTVVWDSLSTRGRYSRITSTSGLYVSPFRSRCSGNLAYADTRVVDGPYELYRLK